ncbi:MAG: HAD hydrolase family protein [Phycisphaeraceae bacterium]|nr:HAD hydrolase family protein [Phycisphaeraceae bacterium]
MADLASIRLIGLDVDGVLTDGSIMLDDQGREIKRFNVRDGLGITAWQRLGFHVAVITRRSGGAVDHRMRELGVANVVQGSRDKGRAMTEIADRLGVPLNESAFVGDDWADLPAMSSVGLAVAVSDADERVRRTAALVLACRGGRGAVRELIDRLIEAKGLTERAVALFSGE